MPSQIIALVGPTAVGKTDVSIALAKRLGAEIIGCDSMQVYRQMPVLSQQPSAEERALVPHHLIDCVEPTEPFNAGRYRKLALPVLEDLRGRGAAALIVGGTGLYLKTLMEGLCETPAADQAARERLMRRIQDEGVEALYEELVVSDPVAAAGIARSDARRITRALEVLEATGRPLSSFWAEQAPGMAMTVIGLRRERDELYDRINRRVLTMLDKGGVLDEVRSVLGLALSATARQVHGLPHLEKFLTGLLTRDEMIAAWQQQVRNYAKRQLTWFRSTPGIQWVTLKPGEAAASAAERILHAAQAE